MNEILHYIHDHITESLQVGEVASTFGYSKWHFCKKFHEYTHMTFVEYIRYYRIQLAAIDILQGKRITDVAMEYGYDTTGGFNKAFLKMYGCMPREYKKQAKESQLYYERRKNNMYKLSDRCNMLRKEAVELKSHAQYYCLQRNIYIKIGVEEARKRGAAPDIVIAEGIANVLREFTPHIIPGEWITGFNFGADEDMGYKRLSELEEEQRTELMKINYISPENEARFYQAVLEESRREQLHKEDMLLLTKTEMDGQTERAALGRCISDNHSVIGYEKVLSLGFEGLLEEVLSYRKINPDSVLYEGMEKVCCAALSMGEKYAEEAKHLLEQKDAAYNEEDLKEIIKICSRVPRYPAQSFAEAIQALWFAHIINTWEDGINANSLGRLDQILYPYYKADIEKGVLTKEDAFELICCLWIKLYRDYDVQQSCVGGTTADGRSAVNELSYMMLDATECLDFVRCLSVRFSEKTEKAFLTRALEVVGHVQKGIPFFFNDDVMIPALIDAGIAEKDAYDYTQIGCVETVIPGKSNPHAVTGETNLLKAMEYVFCNGFSMANPSLCPGLLTGELEQFDTYEKFYEAVLMQVDGILDSCCSQVRKYCDACVVPKPFKSLLTEGCLERELDFNERGAKYDYYQIMLGGIPNLADSLAVIKKLVYEEKRYSLESFKEILVNDFPDEAVRLECINKVPKFGNDIDEVDQIATDIVNRACDTLMKLSEKYERAFHAQPFTYLWMIDQGKHSAASPDGRRRGEPVAYSVSPMQGRDFNGLTAVFNSICKLPTKRTPGTTSAIIEVDPKLFTDRNIGILTELLIASGKKGLSNVQFNTVDADTLIDARKHPENHKNLAVRVSGFSQKFHLLKPELQDHIIERTKHSCL